MSGKLLVAYPGQTADDGAREPRIVRRKTE
jgi:hypothetical protein